MKMDFEVCIHKAGDDKNIKKVTDKCTNGSLFFVLLF